VFSVRYGLDFYMLFKRNSVFKGLILTLKRSPLNREAGWAPRTGLDVYITAIPKLDKC
jgi:hypothetical protein